ncbi:MAG: hypothetical protein V4605_08550 [Pseudomonadota bacterium]
MRNDSGMASEQEYKCTNAAFCEWLEATQQPIWDDRLVDLMEDVDMQLAYLDWAELPADTELI